MKSNLSNHLARSQKILIIDDEPLILKLTMAIFEDEGYQVITADTPELALDIINEHGESTSAFIIDLGLIKKSTLKENIVSSIQKTLPPKPILFISGSPLNEENQELIKNKLNAFLLKPFSINEITETIARLVSRPSL
jgi:DNA-binding NtrC family response regulator